MITLCTFESESRKRKRREWERKMCSACSVSFPILILGRDDQMEEGVNLDWTPPTEAEMKVIQAKKERSDKISKLMGEYLLKGYRMLATTCAVCGVGTEKQT